MEQLNDRQSLWRSSTTLIFWGTLALTIFGGVAYVFETIVGSLDIFVRVAKSYAGITDGEGGSSLFMKVFDNMSTAMRIFELLMIAGWVAYVVGLSKFRSAQTTQRGSRLAGNLYTACWLGLSSMFCYFLAGWLGWFGILFNIAGWILLIVSLFKFRGTFNKLETEQSWNSKAREGASSLRKSYTFAIILLFYLLACGIILLLMTLGMAGELSSIVAQVSSYGPEGLLKYASGMVAVLVILGLAGLVMWILKFVYLLIGWMGVNAGRLVETAEGDMTLSDGENYEVIANATDDDYQESNGNVWSVIGGIIECLVVTVLIIWACFAGTTKPSDSAASDDVEAEVSEVVEEIYDGEQDRQPVMQEETVGKTAAATDSREKVYRGAINGKYGIEMRLVQEDDDIYSGEYFYTKYSKPTPIALSGRLIDDDILVMEEYVNGKHTGTFQGTLGYNSYYGTWTSTDGSKEFGFEVRRH